MFGIGMPELLIIMVIALLVLGPKRLPDVARSLGRGMAEFRRASTDLQRSLTAPIDEIKETVEEAGREEPDPRPPEEPAPEKKADG